MFTARSSLALAAVTTALVVLAGCGDAEEPVAADTRADASPTSEPTSEPTSQPTSQPTSDPTPEPTGVQEIPDDFPLARDLPETNGDDGSPVRVTDSSTFTDFRLCGEPVWSPEGTVDVAAVTYHGEAEDTRARTLTLYTDDAAAQAALTNARETITACPTGTEGGTEQVYEEVEGDDDSATITHRYRTDGRFDTGLEVLQLVRTGNALYLASYYGEGGGTPEAITSSITFAHESSTPVLDAMSVFTEGEAASSGGELDDVPLAAGWPDDSEPGSDGLEVPVDSFVADFPDYACGDPAPAAESTDVLRGQFSNVEDYRTRELVVFAGAESAVAWVDDLRDFYETCPVQREDGMAYPVTLLDSAVGGQSFGVVRSTEYQGEAAIGLSALHVVRVGRSVLLDTTSGEGWAPNPEVDGRRVLDAMSEDAAGVVAAQCVFTEAGC